MRLWSIHPKYLDPIGLVALWREALLAKKVLEGKTKGYKNHPELIKFKTQKNPLNSINLYLYYIFKESEKRGYNFNKSKIGKKTNTKIKIEINQIKFEFQHLKNKLKIRNIKKYKELNSITNIEPHPSFIIQ